MQYVNTILAITVLIIINLVKAELIDEMVAAAMSCTNEFPDIKEDILNLFDGKIEYHNADDEYKCYVKCIMETQGSFVNGSLNIRALHKNIHDDPGSRGYEEMVQKKAEICQLEVGINDCDTAFKIALCLSEK
ncbi:general odorant-binding protein 56h-like [Haematobia irritans]|uniref:general odorant-binding protein 56h-like n=1 Tax=Haematobia irritans TaxID=7368 RepID=UPI003F503887